MLRYGGPVYREVSEKTDADSRREDEDRILNEDDDDET